nr:hypothetical protein [uncultured Alloprevotella sp.]
MMFEDSTKFIKYTDLKWSGILKSIKKSSNRFQPLFEAFTNSLEAIKLRQKETSNFSPYINVVLNFNTSLIHGEYLDLSEIRIEDNGIGFDAKNYARLTTFKDDTKGFNNRGSGRIQMVHSFKYVVFDSVYYEGEKLMARKFFLSKSTPFLSNNTIIYEENTPYPIEGEVKTVVTLHEPLDKKDAKALANIGVDDVKHLLLERYLLALCSIRKQFPSINIIYSIGNTEKERVTIKSEDIPEPTRTDIYISVPKCQISNDMKRIEVLKDESVTIQILPYKIGADSLSESSIRITSKDEISETTKVKLTCINPSAVLDSSRYLFLLKSEYFDLLDGDERGNIEIVDRTEFKKRAKSQGYIEEQIVLNDIQDAVNSKAKEIYQEILEQNQLFKEKIEQLKRDYLLSEEALKDLSLSDSIDEVFKKAYTYDAKVMAKESAAFENSKQYLHQLDPASDDYDSRLTSLTEKFVSSLPIQNRVTLSKYVARRKMVIELMDMILKRTLNCQQEAKRNNDERLLHNLIFRQHSNNPLSSDLWLINEDYMYFEGSSEKNLFDIRLRGLKVFREEFNEEEQRYLKSLGKDRTKLRTDVLLFPAEGKCVIIEFKNPNVNVADCIQQVAKYAYFLRNYTKPEFKFLTFYGYLIGESIEKRDVRAADADFVTSPNLDYLFRPSKKIVDESSDNQDGTLYMEVIQFSVLKQRAELRNKIFADLLLGHTEENIGVDNSIE